MISGAISATPRWDTFVDTAARLGENPIWDSTGGQLLWIDGLEGTLHRSRGDGRVETWDCGQHVGSYAVFTDRSRCLVACADGIYELSLDSGAVTLRHAAPYDTAVYQFNDGRCDKAGRFWVGTLGRPGVAEGTGAYWRLDGTDLTRVIEGITTANGTAFAPDGKTMYVADRPNWQILAFDYDASTGTPSGRRTFARLPEGKIPDGATVDDRGGYWVAIFRAGAVARFEPDGTLDRVLQVPVSRPTMVCFGGDDLETLFVTTASVAFTDADAADEAGAGAVFCCRPGARGLPEPTFEPERAKR